MSTPSPNSQPTQLRCLKELQATPEGRDWLLANGVYSELPAFAAALTPPNQPGLAPRRADGSLTPIVFGSQQLYCDYTRSVLGKLEALQQLEREWGLAVLWEWVDADDAGSDHLITRFGWPISANQPVRLVPVRRAGGLELRWVQLEPHALEGAAHSLRNHVGALGRRGDDAFNRLRQLETVLCSPPPPILSDLNYKITHLLLQQTIGWSPSNILTSELIRAEWFHTRVEQLLDALPLVIERFNGAIALLESQGINPSVRPLKADFLPLYLSCQQDGRRLPLRREARSGGQYAVAHCPSCGLSYSFWLGGASATLAELVDFGRWSPNLCLPLFVNNCISGMVVGQSSALYGLVLRAVLAGALNERPVPLYAPPSIAPPGKEPDSLLYRFLFASPLTT